MPKTALELLGDLSPLQGSHTTAEHFLAITITMCTPMTGNGSQGLQIFEAIKAMLNMSAYEIIIDDENLVSIDADPQVLLDSNEYIVEVS